MTNTADEQSAAQTALRAAALEKYKAELALWVEDRKAYHATTQSMFTAAASFANGALRGLLLVNGGSIVAILTFLGNFWARDQEKAQRLASMMSKSTASFVTGIICALAATMAAYLSQIAIMELGRETFSKGWWIGGTFRGLACILAIASLAAFCWGAITATKALAS